MNIISAMSGRWRTAREGPAWPLSLCAVLLLQALLATAATAVQVSLPAVEIAAGETARVPVTISGVGVGSDILSLNADIRFDAGVLPVTAFTADRRSSLTSSWSLAANARLLPEGGGQDGQLLIAGATATAAISGDGTLLFIDITVPEDATPGTTSPLHILTLFFNNGDPPVTTVDGSVTIVAPRVKADFTGHPLEGPAPLEVRFEDLSSDDISVYAWDFGDGGSSSRPSPRHIYEGAGTYTVRLTVTSGSGSDTETKTDYITVTPDQRPPAIVEGPVITSITHNSAHAGWVTNEQSTSQVDYCGLRFRPRSGSVAEILSGLTDELDDDEETVAEKLQRGTLRHFEDDSVLPIDCERRVDDTLVLEHGIGLTGLRPATFYLYRVRSTDAAGNASAWKGGFFVTRLRPDDDPPRIIRGPQVTATPDRALVSWRTNEISNSLVSWSRKKDFSDDERVLDDDLVTSHEIWIDVEPGTRYYVRVRSTDASGNSSALKSTRFRTPVADDDPPALIGAPIVTRRTATQAVLVWTTDEAATSRVEYGVTEDYGSSVEDDRLVRRHQLVLNDLTPRTVYHFRVLSADASGNEVASRNFSFITAADGDDERPRFRLLPYVLKTLHDRVIIGWESSEEARAVIEFGRDEEFGEIFEVAAARRSQRHTLTGLAPGTVFFYRVLLTDLSGNGPTRSRTAAFRTASVIDTRPPVLVGLPRVVRRTEERITVEWETDEVSDSRIEYGLSSGQLDLQAGDDRPTRRHSVTLTHLRPATTYVLQVYSTDPDGNEVSAPPLTVTTRSDADRPPVRILSGPDVVARTASTVLVEWLTDRPATSTIEYGINVNLDREVALTGQRRFHRVMLTGLSPSTMYFLQAVSDADGDEDVVTSRVLAVSTRAQADDRAPRLRHVQVERVTATSVLLSWRTDEPAGGWVEMGDREGEYDRDFGDERLKRRHQVLVTGLQADRRYHYRLRVRDASGNRRFGKDRQVRTGSIVDERPPRFVEGPVVVTSHASATFIWRTDEPCFGSVAVGTESSLGSADEELFEAQRLGHEQRVTVTGLRAGVRYRFAVLATDVAGHTTVFGDRRPGAARVVRPAAGDFSFVTTLTEDVTPPVFTAGPRELSRSDSDVLIGWQTDEVSDTRLFLVGEDGAEELVDYIAEHDLDHQALITGLTGGTTYRLVAASTDPSGNGPARSALFTFTTRITADTDAPAFVVQPVLLSLTDEAATLAWETDEAATALVRFGTRSLDRTQAVPTPGVARQVQLTGLAPGTTYRVQVDVDDGPGNGPTRSSEISFTTPGAADAVPPRIVAEPRVEALTSSSATVLWSTDEGADGFVALGVSADSLDRSFGAGGSRREHRVVLTSLEAGVTYYYRVSSVDAWGNGPTASEILSFTVPDQAAVTDPPQGLRALLGAQRVQLIWEPPASGIGVLVYRAESEGDFQLVAGPVEGTTYTDQGLAADGRYRYRISTVSAQGEESAYSPPVEAYVTLDAGDFDGDGLVGFEDFFLFVDQLGRRAGETGFDARFDLDSDDSIGIEDFFLFATIFGTRYSSARPLALPPPERVDRLSLAAAPVGATGYEVGIRLPAASRVYAIDLRFDVQALRFTGAGSPSILALPVGEGRVLITAGREAVEPLNLTFQTWPGAPAGTIRIEAARGIGPEGHSWVAAATPPLRLQPQQVALLPNVPNPFNPSTQIRFQLPATTPVWMSIHDALGQRVATLLDGQVYAAGLHGLTWQGRDGAGRNVASGLYFLVFEAAGRRHVGKLLLLR